MSWTKREAVTNLVILGDGPDHKKKVSGLLADCPFDKMYPDKMNYVLVQQNGEEVLLSGSASLGRQLAPSDIGKFVKCEFTGWGHSGNGKFKAIDVFVYDGELTPAMKKWPRFGEVHPPAPAPRLDKTKKREEAPAPTEFEDFPDDLGETPDDLPF